MARARPLAKTTVVTPSTTAAKVRALRAGRANGSPSPMLTERGSREPASLRCVFSPRPRLGAEPAEIAAIADIPAARRAGR